MFPEPNEQGHNEETLVLSGLDAAPLTDQEAHPEIRIASKMGQHKVALVDEHVKMPDTSGGSRLQSMQLGAAVTQNETRYRSQITTALSGDYRTDQGQSRELDEEVQPSIQRARHAAPLYDQSMQSKKKSDIDERIEKLSRALELDEEVQSLIQRAMHAALLYDQSMQSKKKSDIDEVIENLSLALELRINDDTLLACLSSLAIALQSRFDWFGAQEDLERSIEYIMKAIHIAPNNHPGEPGYLKILGMSWLRRFKLLGELADLDHTLACQSLAVDLTPDGHSDKASHLNSLGASWFCRFERLGELADLNHALECQSRAVYLTPDDHPDKPIHLNNLIASWSSRFEQLGELADLDHALDYQSQAVDLTPEGDPDKPIHLNNLGASWSRRFERLGELADLDRALACLRLAVDLIPDDHPHRPRCLNNLGNTWSHRFERLGELADLDHALHFQSQAVDLTPDGHPDKPGHLNSLGNSWNRRFDRLRELADLDRALGCHSWTADLIPDDHPEKSVSLSNLGASWSRRFERLGELADLDRALACLRLAVDLIPDDHPHRPGCLNNLGQSCSHRFERLGELADFDHALGYQSQAVDLTPDDHPDKAMILNNLGLLWSRRFDRLGELADLDHALDFRSQAVDLTPDGHPEKPGRLNNLGNSWLSRYERLGVLADLDHALGCFSQAVDLTSDGDPDKPNRLSNLGASWYRRYERLGELADSDHALRCLSQAVDFAPGGHPDKPSCLDNLGLLLSLRFKRLGELPDLDHSLRCLSQAADLIPDGHPLKPGCLNNLGVSWCYRFEHLGELADLDHALDCQSRAVDLIPDGDPDKPDCLTNLGSSWYHRFDRLGELADIDHALECQLRAVDLTPDGHPDKPAYLKNLGDSWYRRFERLGEHVDLQKACCAFRDGATVTTFNPSAQMQCAKMWARTCKHLGSSPLDAYHAAFSLLPRLVWIGQATRYRHETMITVRDLASQAAAWAISAKSYDLALEWLEQGRSVVWGQTLQLRTPFEGLHLANPQLALKLQHVTSQLDAAICRPVKKSQNTTSLVDLVSEGAKHHELAAEWDMLLGEARQLPGFENFLQPLKSNELKQAARHGPIIIINIYLTQCDALILLPGHEDIVHVQLNTTRLENLHQSIAEAHSSMGPHGDPENTRGFKRSTTQDTPLPVLTWLFIVEPVFKLLGYTESTMPSELPHVTWCTTGAISLLPLHAAGMYDGKTPNAADLVVSSYTPTLTALLWHRNPSSSQVGLLAVGQQASPGQAALPNTAKELEAIRKYGTVTAYHELEGVSATVEATLTAMEENSWVHLACHAVQDLSDPSQSAFHLHDGPLMLEEIARWQFKNKGLAFLSACETATGDRALPDEATHLAAGMLIAGYPSVIGTMWSIKDEDAPLVADVVYSELLKDGKLDHTRSARALHKAVKLLREKVGEEQIWRWAPFIHIGI